MAPLRSGPARSPMVATAGSCLMTCSVLVGATDASSSLVDVATCYKGVALASTANCFSRRCSSRGSGRKLSFDECLPGHVIVLCLSGSGWQWACQAGSAATGYFATRCCTTCFRGATACCIQSGAVFEARFRRLYGRPSRRIWA